MTRPILAALLTLAALSPAVGQDAPPACDGDGPQAALTDCAGRAFEAADAALNDAYRPAMAAMTAIDDTLPEGERGAALALRDAQRAWIAYRDTACEAEGFPYAGGSIRPMVEADCRTRLTQARTADLGLLTEPN